MFIVVGLIVLIAAFNIITSLVMLVQQKSKDIAILRTMGATRKQIMHTFFFCGALLGIVGTTLGVTIGMTIAANLDEIRKFLEKLLGITLFPADFWLTKVPAVLLKSDIISTIVLSISLSLLATLYPSWRAAKMKPVEALRYE
jgi:lipoprotein-releasing system permease protein